MEAFRIRPPSVAAIALLLLLAPLVGFMPTATTRADVMKTTYVYKKIGTLEIKADVYREAKVEAGLRPVVVWIHGGGMINGHREGLFAPIQSRLLAAGAIVVSIDYRLGPETKLAEYVTDIDDAFRWVRAEGPKLFGGDPSRTAVFGGSAGGYLALSAGYRVEPRVRAIVSLWGYGGLTGEWTDPSPHERHAKAPFTAEQAEKVFSGPAVADSRERKGDGGAFYQYVRRRGTWVNALSGIDPRFHPDKLEPFMPVKNVTSKYPPTLLIHGEADTDVPFEQSQMMAEQFKKHGVEHRLIAFPGAEHGLPGVEQAKLDEAYGAAAEFLLKHLGP
jgi:acetyl esterase/lipase